MIYTIYKITNKKSKKCYIGATSNWKQRQYFHKKRFKSKKFTFKILAEYNSPTELFKAEQYWIWRYNSFKKGYNRNRGGYWETRAKGSSKQKNYKTYTIAIDQALAERIEKLKEKGNKTYTELFIEGIKKLLGDGS